MAAILLQARPKVPLSFEDVCLYFTKAEWKFLDCKQKALYKHVMLENYRNMASLGLASSKPYLVAQIEQGGPGPWLPQPQSKAGGSIKSPRAAKRARRQGDSTASQRSPQGRRPATRPQRPKGAEKRYLCQQCGKSFSRSSSLLKHQVIHSAQKPFSCRECGKLFRHGCTLLEHERTHSSQKPYECVHCSKAFSRSSKLIEHELTHSDQKPYLCDQCPKAFTSISQLIYHQRVHIDYKPFACAECGKAFFGRLGLSQHQRVHSGEKPYECTECGKAFGRWANLFKHQAVHGDVHDRGSQRGCALLLERQRGPWGALSPESCECSGESSSPEAWESPEEHACEHCQCSHSEKSLGPGPQAQPMGGDDDGPHAGPLGPAKPQDPFSP